MRICDIKECNSKHMARGLCGKHYHIALKNGSLPALGPYWPIKAPRQSKPTGRRPRKYAVIRNHIGPYNAVRTQLFVLQGGVCALCGEYRDLVLDHDHETGYIRGLLCSGCNGWLQYNLRRDKAFLITALRYLTSKPPALD